MNKQNAGSGKGSLLERAADIYDFEAALRGRAAPKLEQVNEPVVPAVPELSMSSAEQLYGVNANGGGAAGVDFEAPQMWMAADWTGPIQSIDQQKLAEGGFVVPSGSVTTLSEEFRLLKRELLSLLVGSERGNRILVCSAESDEGKSFCAINLALSLSAEKNVEILLVDTDFGRPGIPEVLGLTTGPGLMDALLDPMVAIEDCIIRTDIPSLSILPAGRHTPDDTEYLASVRTEDLLQRLTQGRPDRILVFDSPPLLAASAAAVLATHASVALLVVRADRTNESTVREALTFLKSGIDVRLLLNDVTMNFGARRFGTYHEREDAQ